MTHTAPASGVSRSRLLHIGWISVLVFAVAIPDGAVTARDAVPALLRAWVS